MRKTLAAIALLAIAGLTLSACAENPDGAATGGGSSDSPVNDADVTFAREMIPHHEQAVDMAQLAKGRASSGEVRKLAESIEAAQGPEIDTLERWLEAWGEEAPSGEMDHGGMGHGSDDAGAGMMDEGEMNDLRAATGASWDRMFLEMMVEHHEGAIEMATVEADEGENPDAVALAETIISDQQAEITRMRELLESS